MYLSLRVFLIWICPVLGYDFICTRNCLLSRVFLKNAGGGGSPGAGGGGITGGRVLLGNKKSTSEGAVARKKKVILRGSVDNF